MKKISKSFTEKQKIHTDAIEMSFPSCEKEMVRTGHSRNENVLTQANSLTSHRETRASALPTAKYLPVGSNSMQMQLAGCACNTAKKNLISTFLFFKWLFQCAIYWKFDIDIASVENSEILDLTLSVTVPLANDGKIIFVYIVLISTI